MSGAAVAGAVAVRAVGPGDLGAVLGLLRGLAEYERMLDRFRATENGLRAALFGPRAPLDGVLAEDGQGRAVGVALWSRRFGTFSCRMGYWLEDIYVVPEARGSGAGRALFAAMAERLRAEGGAVVAWDVLGWNAPAIGFYERLGARRADDEWTEMRLDGEALARLAA